MDDPAVTTTDPVVGPAATPETLDRQLELVRRQLVGLAILLFAVFLLLAGAGPVLSGVVAVIGLLAALVGW